MKNLTPIEKALLTWYEPDNPKYLNSLHPTIKLAGEIGELLDLYAKHLFKPGFNWMDCKWCNKPREKEHYQNQSNKTKCWEYKGAKNYTSKVIDELGDIWYYLRILAWQNKVKLRKNWYDSAKSEMAQENLDLIKKMYKKAGKFMENENSETIKEIYYNLLLLLVNLDYTIDQLTELNYQKLNSEKTNHGWKDAA